MAATQREKFLAIILAGLLTLTSQATLANAVCKQGDLERQVTTVYSDPGQPTPCEVLYEKPDEGQSMTLWRAANQAGYCESKANQFVAKLESLGWDCGSTQTSPTGQTPTAEQPSIQPLEQESEFSERVPANLPTSDSVNTSN